jgi:hypothetical protein
MEKVKGERDCQQPVLSMYNVTENIHYSSVTIFLQPEPVSHHLVQGKDCVFSPSVLSSFSFPLPPSCLVLTVSEARSYFASTIHGDGPTGSMKDRERLGQQATIRSSSRTVTVSRKEEDIFTVPTAAFHTRQLKGLKSIIIMGGAYSR